jgi:CelD/BcsL family acetyltransferase involved in cellulose biosynthesis
MDAQSKVPVRISVIETEKEFRELAERWNGLVKQSAGSVFLKHEWFDAAWAWRKEDSSLFLLLAWRGQELLGILPLIRVRPAGQFPKLRGLEFLTVPDTQVCDVITAPENRILVIDAACEALHKRRNEWDHLTLRYLSEKNPILNEIKTGLTARGYACDIKPHGPNLFVKLDTTWDAYYSTRSRSLKKANNLAANRLKKSGEIAIRWISRETADGSAIEKALEETIEISRRSWKQGTGNSLDQAGPKGFISTLTAHAARNGWLSIWLLAIEGKVLAMEYQLLDAENVYALRADFDAECEEISPGSHLMRTLLETLFGRGLQRYYMGPGENAYKTRWTEDNEMLQQLVVHGSTWRGQVARVRDDILKPAARTLRDKFATGKAPPQLQNPVEPKQ